MICHEEIDFDELISTNRSKKAIVRCIFADELRDWLRDELCEIMTPIPYPEVEYGISDFYQLDPVINNSSLKMNVHKTKSKSKSVPNFPWVKQPKRVVNSSHCTHTTKCPPHI